ncbi:acyl carrier protein phosphodiesterase [Lascolabacillus massiliensis]|uniref:acyl carrier protein phosphodiesterase n=1 Tax=Lascolabacillus massiliensis TaxID=1627894 RepID=UPI0006B375FE|nr:ACP phosphodiesterase [Lascolabacillus massiliensis]
MNYLAHIYFSGTNRKVAVGNFIGDFVKGKSYEKYPSSFQKGILLHRKIDHFTDTHPIFLETVDILRPSFGRYSGIMADMYYDYLLASDFERYSNGQSLGKFSRNFYLSALLYYRWLPKKVKGFIFHFIRTNRLEEYATYDGLQYSLKIMSVHSSSAINPTLGIEVLAANEVQLRSLFDEFMKEAQQKFPH